jgi:hypothetical protein
MKSSKLINDIDPAEVAEEHYNSEYGRLSFKQQIRRFGLPEATESEIKQSSDLLSMKVREWEKQGMIVHTVLRPNTEFLPRDHIREHALRREFGLRQAVVVDIGSLPVPQGTPETAKAAWNSYDDEIHRRLGA